MTPVSETILTLIFLWGCRYHNVNLIAQSYIILLSQIVSYLMIECMDTETMRNFIKIKLNWKSVILIQSSWFVFAEDLNLLNRLQLHICLCDQNLLSASSRPFGASALPLTTWWIRFIPNCQTETEYQQTVLLQKM